MITTPPTELEVNKESVSCNLEMYGGVCSTVKKKNQLPHTLHPRLSQHYVVHESNAFNHFLVLSCVSLPLLLLPASVLDTLFLWKIDTHYFLNF